VTTTGVDEAWARAPISVLNASGYRFVVRYLSYDTTGKNLSLAEAQALSAAGLAVVSNWEYAAQAARNGHAQGIRDATEAARQHTADGGPPDRPIYFSVDYDVPDYAPNAGDPAAKLGPIADYFRAVASVIGPSRVGAYGGYWPIKRLFDAGLIRWGWQTYAWSGGQWDSRAQLRQVQNGVTVGGADVDIDKAQIPDFGQWTTTGAVPITPAPGGLAVDGTLGQLTVRRWQQIMGTPVDGVIDQPPKRSSLVMAVQRRLNGAIGAGLVVDGQGIHQDGRSVYKTTRALQRYLGTTQDGVLSVPVSECVKALQRRLNAGRF
jgi:hypothetical protein